MIKNIFISYEIISKAAAALEKDYRLFIFHYIHDLIIVAIKCSLMYKYFRLEMYKRFASDIWYVQNIIMTKYKFYESIQLLFRMVKLNCKSFSISDV